MKHFWTRALLAVSFLMLTVLGAQAQMNILPEVRGGIMSRDAGHPAAGGLLDATRIRDANVELLFAVPDLNNWLLLGELRPHVGATVSTVGQESFAYAGLSYTVAVPVVPVFAEASIGAAVHGGPFATPAPARFGCAALARGSASLGVNVLPGASIIATVEHYTDFGMCGLANDGVTNVGVRLGFRF